MSPENGNSNEEDGKSLSAQLREFPFLASGFLFLISLIALVLSLLGSGVIYLQKGYWEFLDNKFLLEASPELVSWLASMPTNWVGLHKIAVWYFSHAPITALIVVLSFFLLCAISSLSE